MNIDDLLGRDAGRHRLVHKRMGHCREAPSCVLNSSKAQQGPKTGFFLPVAPGAMSPGVSSHSFDTP